MPDVLVMTMPSGSTRFTVMFLYSVPSIVLKSSAITQQGNKQQQKIASRIMTLRKRAENKGFHRSRCGTPPCKSGQLEKDLGLEVSSARHAARLIIFKIMRSFFVGGSALVAHLLDLRYTGTNARNLRTLAISVSALLQFNLDSL